MSTFLFDEIVVGPVASRRFGKSLGINLLSPKNKVCNFDCIYCECGYTKNDSTAGDKFCGIDELKRELADFFNQNPDVTINAITFAGNGEPTLHPKFEAIAQTIEKIRDLFCPSAEIVLLTNGTTLHKQSIKNSVKYIDKVVVKLDAGLNELLFKIDKPLSPFKIENLVDDIKELDHDVFLQSMFLRNHEIDNTTEVNLKNWLRWIELIQPKQVMLYSIARDTPLKSLKVIPKDELENIAKRVEQLGIKTLVS